MFIKQITIEGVEGDVEIMRIETGALVTSGNRVLCEMRADEDRESRFEKALEVAKVVCGTDPRNPRNADSPNATNSMLHDVLREIERVAGC